jgi:hypothetical protein
MWKQHQPRRQLNAVVAKSGCQSQACASISLNVNQWSATDDSDNEINMHKDDTKSSTASKFHEEKKNTT